MTYVEKDRKSFKLFYIFDVYRLVFIYLIAFIILLSVFYMKVKDFGENRYANLPTEVSETYPGEIAELHDDGKIHFYAKTKRIKINNELTIIEKTTEKDKLLQIEDEHGNILFKTYASAWDWSFWDWIFKGYECQVYEYDDEGRILSELIFDPEEESLDAYFYKYKDGLTACIFFENDYDSHYSGTYSLTDEFDSILYCSDAYYQYRCVDEKNNARCYLSNDGEICSYITFGEQGEMLQEIHFNFNTHFEMENEKHRYLAKYKWYAYEAGDDGLILKGAFEIFPEFVYQYTSYGSDGREYIYRSYNMYHDGKRSLETYSGTLEFYEDTIRAADRTGHVIYCDYSVPRIKVIQIDDILSD